MHRVTEIRQGNDFEYLLTPRDVAGIEKITVEKGLGAVNGITSRNFDDVVEGLLRPLQQAGTIGDGVNSNFDDTKVRLHDYRIDRNELVLQLGPTWYQQWKRNCENSEFLVESLKRQGIMQYDDQFAYFSRPLGVAIVPVTLEGHAYIGLRKGVDCSGVLSFPAGWMKFYEDITDVNTTEDVFRELGEFGILESNVLSIKLVGLATHPIRMDGDLVFLAHTNVPDSYFESEEWKEKRTEKEHSRLFALKTAEEVLRLARFGMLGNESFEVLHSSRLGLEALYREMIR